MLACANKSSHWPESIAKKLLSSSSVKVSFKAISKIKKQGNIASLLLQPCVLGYACTYMAIYKCLFMQCSTHTKINTYPPTHTNTHIHMHTTQEKTECKEKLPQLLEASDKKFITYIYTYSGFITFHLPIILHVFSF